MSQNSIIRTIENAPVPASLIDAGSGRNQAETYELFVNGVPIDFPISDCWPPVVPAMTEADRLRKLIDDKVAADEEDKRAEAAFVEARKRLDNAIRKAKACHQELAKALGFSIRADEKVKPAQPPKKKRKERRPIIPYKSTLSGRERMIVLLGVQIMTRKDLEDVARQMGCGTVSSSLISDDTFHKTTDGFWELTGKGRAEFGKLVDAEDGKKFWADAKKLMGYAGDPSPDSDRGNVGVNGNKFSGMTTADMAVVLLGQGGMRQEVFRRVLEAASGRIAGTVLYSTSKAFFQKSGELWGLSEFGKARLKVLLTNPDGQAFKKVVQNALGQTK